jgi:hypothetical protein
MQGKFEWRVVGNPTNDSLGNDKSVVTFYGGIRGINALNYGFAV